MEIILVILYLISLVGIFVLISKMGYPWYYAFWWFIPIANVFFFIYICYAEWPIEKELKQCKIRLGEIPDDSSEDIVTETICLACQTKIAAGKDTCPECGWTYK